MISAMTTSPDRIARPQGASRQLRNTGAALELTLSMNHQLAEPPKRNNVLEYEPNRSPSLTPDSRSVSSSALRQRSARSVARRRDSISVGDLRDLTAAR